MFFCSPLGVRGKKTIAKIADLLDYSMLIFQNYREDSTTGNLYIFL